MEIEYWWLLAFPLFFGLGWLAARIDIKHLMSESRTLPASYFKGLNYLLNEQPDKAVEAFIEVAKLDTQTVELHFTLGGLFRRRGEVERAIRMHQNLVDRPDLGQEQKLSALHELAQDYLKAGLLDRAEDLFEKLRGTGYESEALAALQEIYVQEKEWKKAIACAQSLGERANRSFHKEISHYYCELAANEIVDSNYPQAREHLDAALQINRECVRATILLGDLESAQRQYEAAVRSWRQVEVQSPPHLALLADKLLAAYREQGRAEEGLSLLRDYLARFPSQDILLGAYHATLEVQGPEPAYRLVRDAVRQNPTLQGLDTLLEAQLLDVAPERRGDIQLIKNLVHTHARQLSMYRCENCGFRARRFYWRCPACSSWETLPPRRCEERELYDQPARTQNAH